LKVLTNASEMPFDCGERKGVKQSLRPQRSLSGEVGAAIVDSHSAQTVR
jgi:hypothetical protein